MNYEIIQDGSLRIPIRSTYSKKRPWLFIKGLVNKCIFMNFKLNKMVSISFSIFIYINF